MKRNLGPLTVQHPLDVDFGLRAEANLAVFSKHPGREDPIDDIGMDTDQLIAVRRELYLGGIAGDMDFKWTWLEPASRIEFNPVLCVDFSGADHCRAIGGIH